MTGNDMGGIFVGMAAILSFVIAALAALVGYWFTGQAQHILLIVSMIFTTFGALAVVALRLKCRRAYSDNKILFQ